jgi:hypothetical protein
MNVRRWRWWALGGLAQWVRYIAVLPVGHPILWRCVADACVSGKMKRFIVYIVYCMKQTHGHDEERQGRRHSTRARKSRTALSDTHRSRPGGTWTPRKACFFNILDGWSERTKLSFFKKKIAFGRMEGACVPSCLLLPPVPDLDRLLRCQAWPGVGGLADLFRCRSSSSPASSQASGRYFFLLISLVAWLLAKTVFAQHSVQAASELEYGWPRP